MRSLRVVALVPPFYDHPSLVQLVKQFSVKQLIPQLPVEGLHIAVLPRTAWLDKQRRDGELLIPLSQPPGNKLWTVVAPNMRRAAPEQKQLTQDLLDAL